MQLVEMLPPLMCFILSTVKPFVTPVLDHMELDFAVGGAVDSGMESFGGGARRRHRWFPWRSGRRQPPGSGYSPIRCPEQAGASSASPVRESGRLLWSVLRVAAPCITVLTVLRGGRTAAAYTHGGPA